MNCAKPLHKSGVSLSYETKDSKTNQIGSPDKITIMYFNDLDTSQKYKELVRVFETMERYNRTSGWMRWDGDIMRFYDDKVEDGYYIELSWLKLWISEFWNRYSK